MKIKTLENGDQIKAEVSVKNEAGNVVYDITLYIKLNGKRKWNKFINEDDYSYRRMSTYERKIFKLNKAIETVGSEFLYEAKLEFWNSIKPKKTDSTNIH